MSNINFSSTSFTIAAVKKLLISTGKLVDLDKTAIDNVPADKIAFQLTYPIQDDVSFMERENMELTLHCDIIDSRFISRLLLDNGYKAYVSYYTSDGIGTTYISIDLK